MSTHRQNCLFVVSSAIEGVSAQSFIQAFTLAQTAFNIQLVSPGGKLIEFVRQDDNSRRWLNEFRGKSYSTPIKFESIDASRYSAMVLPDSPGAVHDLAHNPELAIIVKHFVDEKKPICAIAMGVAGLCSSFNDGSWSFKNFSLTAPSVYELAKTPYFSNLSLIPEDFIKDKGARYACGESDDIHIVVDRFLVTAQNEMSTLIALQNLILLSNQRQGKVK